MPTVNKKILSWARETAGLSQEEAAKRLGLSGPHRLKALEDGKRSPSRQQLVKMSDVYHRPLLTFYLQERPRKSDRGQDFRTLPTGQAPGSEGLLDALIRDVLARQGLVRAALEEAEEDVPLPFVNSAQIDSGVDTLVGSMRQVLGFLAEDFHAARTVDEAFERLRIATERAGVFVLLRGNLGSYHTNIEAQVFRGFALADEVAPFVIINENDSRAAWSFTLLHELAHVFLGQTGISGYDGQDKTERFCDSVAGRFLLDPTELAAIQVDDATKIDELIAQINAFAGGRNLSRKMVAYNLLRSDLISGALYRALSDSFDADRRARKDAERDARKEAQRKGGVDYYTLRRHRVGPGLVSFVKRMLAGGTLSTTKAGRVLGVKPTSVMRLVGGDRAA